ncbi:MAG: type IV pilus biogenesis/stability protein PilW [Proteobacteria bacterium]|nr:type IV pilus biogenesis/stability protein PilW [Pseudomonadota bacterium]
MKVIYITLLSSTLLFLTACGSMNKKSNTNSSRTEYVQKVAANSPEMQNVNLGVGYLKRGQPDDIDYALEKFKKAIAINPQFALAHSMIANVYDQKGLFSDAERHYKKSIKFDHGSPDILNNYANFLCQRGKYTEAISKYKEVVVNPQYKTPELAYENAGVCAKKANDNVQAEAFFRKALSHNNKLPSSLYYLMLINLEAKKFMAARAFLQRLENMVQHSPEILVAGYKIESGLNQSKLAQKYLTTLQNQYPSSELLQEIK